jgi:hypothetical protein
MYSEVWKENSFSHKSPANLLEYLETISAGHPDPLSAYLPYINDTKTNLLHPVLHKFLHVPYYENDSRYIKLWIIYADSTGRPEEIYNYLLDRNIGKSSSLLHVALADIYEGYSWHDLAELVYLRAFLSKAEPQSKLHECYEKFKAKTTGKTRYRQPISMEEIKSIPYLKELAFRKDLTPTASPHTTPVIQKSQSRINLSAFKRTPDIERLYHSPCDSKVEPQAPAMVHGRLPLGII